MRIKNRSIYGQGILAYKMGKTIKDNPFTDEILAGIPKAQLWEQGFVHCRDKKWGDMVCDKDGNLKNYDINGSGV